MGAHNRCLRCSSRQLWQPYRRWFGDGMEIRCGLKGATLENMCARHTRDIVHTLEKHVYGRASDTKAFQTCMNCTCHTLHIFFLFIFCVCRPFTSISWCRERERAHCKMRILDMHQTMDERKDYVWRRGSYIMHDSTIARYLISVSVYYAEGVIKLCVCVVLDMCLDIPCLALYMRK